MSSQTVSTDRDLDRTRSTARDRHTTPTETKPSFLTTEFYAMIAGIVAVLVAAQQADNPDAPLAWTLAAAIAIATSRSRPLERSGGADASRAYATCGLSPRRRSDAARAAARRSAALSKPGVSESGYRRSQTG